MLLLSYFHTIAKLLLNSACNMMQLTIVPILMLWNDRSQALAAVCPALFSFGQGTIGACSYIACCLMFACFFICYMNLRLLGCSHHVVNLLIWFFFITLLFDVCVHYVCLCWLLVSNCNASNTLVLACCLQLLIRSLCLWIFFVCTYQLAHTML